MKHKVSIFTFGCAVTCDCAVLWMVMNVLGLVRF